MINDLPEILTKYRARFLNELDGRHFHYSLGLSTTFVLTARQELNGNDKRNAFVKKFTY